MLELIIGGAIVYVVIKRKKILDYLKDKAGK